MLIRCNLPERMGELYQQLIKRMSVLQASMDEYKDIYQPDLYLFNGYYIPEALKLTQKYIGYRDSGMDAKALRETEEDVISAVERLLNAINDEIDEICKYATMDVKARAKALEGMLNLKGYADPAHSISADNDK